MSKWNIENRAGEYFTEFEAHEVYFTAEYAEFVNEEGKTLAVFWKPVHLTKVIESQPTDAAVVAFNKRG